MRDYVAENWKACLEKNGLRTFEDFWRLKADWFEPPNERRGGWSGVARVQLENSPGNIRVFIKRQENHITKTLRHPLRGIPTLEREFKNILRYQRLNIPSLTAVYYAQRVEDGNLRAVLVTEELSGFRSLEDIVGGWQASGWPALPEKKKVIDAVVELLKLIHGNHLRHQCFFPKHILLRFDTRGEIETRIIDLEKTKWQPWDRAETSRDFRNLARESPGWTLADRVRFYKTYLGVKKLSERDKANWMKLQKRISQKYLAKTPKKP